MSPKSIHRRHAVATVLVFLAVGLPLAAESRGDDYLPWRTYVIRCADTLIEHGRDRYGPVHSGMFMAVLDVETLDSPADPAWLDTEMYFEGRAHRRAMRGSNFWYDQATIRVLYALSKSTGDAKYADAADGYARAVFQHAVKKNGLFVWGSHIFYDAYTDKAAGDRDGRGPHEMLVYHAEWPQLYRIDAAATRRAVDAIWEWHVVDHATGQHNRHDDKHVGCDFAFAGGAFAQANAAMFQQTKEPKYLQRAKTIADWHWRHRHPETLLVPDAPSTGSRYDAHHCFTTVPGPYAAYLLKCHELTGDDWFLDVAVNCLKAYHKWGFDKEAGNYHAMIQLDGTPVLERTRGAGYDAWAPTGYVDIWKASIYSYEFPLIAAQNYLYGYELTADPSGRGDAELLEAARCWAALIEKNLPPKVGRRWNKEIIAALPDVETTGGSYAEDYGRTISFFVHLYRATGERRYLELAENTARTAVDKLYENGLFKAHPAKPYYEATQGVGILLVALLELDQPDAKPLGAF